MGVNRFGFARFSVISNLDVNPPVRGCLLQTLVRRSVLK
jgi:hypothetical protein